MSNPENNSFPANDSPVPHGTPAANTAPVANNAGDNDAESKGSLRIATWISLFAGVFLLVLLIMFIVQNQHEVPMIFLGWENNLPAGLAYLGFAIAGGLIVGLIAGWRIFNLHRQNRRLAKKILKL